MTQNHVTQAAELVERLRSTWPKSPDFGPITTAQRDTIHEAADLIERLSAELAARSGGWEAAKTSALEAVEDVRRRNAGNFGRGGVEWSGYDNATLDCHAAISSMEAPSHDQS